MYESVDVTECKEVVQTLFNFIHHGGEEGLSWIEQQLMVLVCSSIKPVYESPVFFRDSKRIGEGGVIKTKGISNNERKI